MAAVCADALVGLVLDGDEPWWRRRACALALTGRVPAAHAIALVDCVRDDGVTGEIREALLTALSVPGEPHSDGFLAWLRAQEGGQRRRGFDLQPAILWARANMADLTAAGPLAVLAWDPWKHRRTVGEQAIDALIELHGLPALLAAFGVDSLDMLASSGSSEPERLLGVRLLRRAGGDITPSLADVSTIVARKAYELLADGDGETDRDDDTLVAMVRGRRPGHLWALAVLHRRGHAIKPMWEALGSPRIELPGVPPDVRQAIVGKYAPGRRDTDPRWLIEAACLEPAPHQQEAELLERATRALTAAGMDPQEPIHAADEYSGEGSGTYHVVHTNAGRVTVSTLGPYFSHSPRDNDDGARVISTLQAAGFRYIDGTLAAIRFAGLHVYFFGDRDSLNVGDLLFYWQD